MGAWCSFECLWEKSHCKIFELTDQCTFDALVHNHGPTFQEAIHQASIDSSFFFLVFHELTLKHSLLAVVIFNSSYLLSENSERSLEGSQTRVSDTSELVGVLSNVI